ncbi:MAG: cysteine desulfurase [Hydrogenophilus sp.]|nr:cysteine desulfurase [Hydrogenophilus sp.]
MASYLDWNASAPLHPRAVSFLEEWLREGKSANASSRHRWGEYARAVVEQTRHRVAEMLGVMPNQVVFTSGGSEANNAFLKGAAWAIGAPRTAAISAVEHPCVREPARQLTRWGWQVREIEVDGRGKLQWEAVERVLRERPALVSVMLANNETGVLQPVAEVARAARAVGAVVHCDAVQGWGKVAFDFASLGVDALTLSGHKIGAPQGVGVLVFNRRVEWVPLIAGGGQEMGWRSGTENVAAIGGLGAVLEVLTEVQRVWETQARLLQERLEGGLRARGAVIFGEGAARLPNTTYFAFPGRVGESWVIELDRVGFAVASGSACSSGRSEGSVTLRAMGVDPSIARGAIRVSTGWSTGAEEIDAFLQAVDALMERERKTAVVQW